MLCAGSADFGGSLPLQTLFVGAFVGPRGRFFASHWLMAPFYLGLVVALAALLVVFVRELIHEIGLLPEMNAEGAILMALSLIDMSLAGNLMLIVIFSGYENFVSRFDAGDLADRPAWMGKVDFSAFKLKLVSSIVAANSMNGGATATMTDEPLAAQLGA